MKGVLCMSMNIIIVVMAVIAFGAGGWCLWYESQGTDSTEEKKTDQ